MIDIGSFIRKHRRLANGAGMLLTIALIFYVVSSPAIVGASASQRILPVYSVERTDKTVAISFDAGWGNEDTEELLDILAAHGVRATFFVVGDWADKYPDSVKAIAQSGCEVMNHSSTHAHFASLTTDQILADIRACNGKVAALTGVEPSLFRCPYGEYDDHVISAVNSLGMTAIQWDVDSLDWKGISAQEITDRVLRSVKDGSIILFHNAAEHTPEALPGILDELQRRGYSVVPVSEILLSGETYLDNTGRQWAK